MGEGASEARSARGSQRTADAIHLLSTGGRSGRATARPALIAFANRPKRISLWKLIDRRHSTDWSQWTHSTASILPFT